MPDIAVRIGRKRPEYFLNGETISDQCQRQLKGIRIDRLPDAEHRAGKCFPEFYHRSFGLFSVCPVVEADAQRRSERVILSGDPVDLVESDELYRSCSQLLLKICRCRSRLRIKDNVKICLRHQLKLFKILTG